MRKALILCLVLSLVGCSGYVTRHEFDEMRSEIEAVRTETRQAVNGLSQQVAKIEAHQRETMEELRGLNVELRALNGQMTSLLGVLIETPIPRPAPDPFGRETDGP